MGDVVLMGVWYYVDYITYDSYDIIVCFLIS